MILYQTVQTRVRVPWMEDINDDVDDDDMTDSSKFNKCVSVKRYFNGRMKNIIFR